MKYKILKTFPGSQDGRFTETFEAGTEAELSDYLAGCAPKDSIEPVTEKPVIKNKAVTSSGKGGKGK